MSTNSSLTPLQLSCNESDSVDGSGADGMRVDRDGRLYVTTRLGIQVCDQAGRVSAIIPIIIIVALTEPPAVVNSKIEPKTLTGPELSHC